MREGVAVSDPVAQAIADIGREYDWKVDIVEQGGRTLIVRDGADVAIGEVLADGQRVMYEVPLPLWEGR